MEDRGLNLPKIIIEKNCIHEVQWKWELGWKLSYQSTGREFEKRDYIFYESSLHPSLHSLPMSILDI